MSKLVLQGLLKHRHLIWSLALREIQGRYRGSFGGVVWSFINPLIMLGVYTFVFSFVFQARWGASSGSRVEFALILFLGMITYGVFAETVNRSPSLIVSSPNLVKKVVFPLEVLPIVVLIAAVFHLLISLVAWTIIYVAFIGVPWPTFLLFPFVLAPLLLVTLGVSWIFASIGVFIRDATQFVAIFTTILLFVSPIFYPISALPEDYRFVLWLNPLTPVIEQVRAVAYWGALPDPLSWAISVLVGFVTAGVGYFFFQKTRKGFSDVL
jgi:lipopolysaccharide transport system permease protein